MSICFVVGWYFGFFDNAIVPWWSSLITVGSFWTKLISPSNDRSQLLLDSLTMHLYTLLQFRKVRQHFASYLPNWSLLHILWTNIRTPIYVHLDCFPNRHQHSYWTWHWFLCFHRMWFQNQSFLWCIVGYASLLSSILLLGLNSHHCSLALVLPYQIIDGSRTQFYTKIQLNLWWVFGRLSVMCLLTSERGFPRDFPCT